MDACPFTVKNMLQPAGLTAGTAVKAEILSLKLMIIFQRCLILDIKENMLHKMDRMGALQDVLVKAVKIL